MKRFLTNQNRKTPKLRSDGGWKIKDGKMRMIKCGRQNAHTKKINDLLFAKSQ